MTAYLYIDPGTGSMLFTILIGIVSALLFFARSAVSRLRFLTHGGRAVREKEDRTREAFVIFSDHKRYWNVFEPVCDELERRGIDAAFLTASPDDPGLQKKYRHIKARFIGEGNAAYAKLNLLRADIVLSTTPGLDVLQWKRSRNVKWYVHILHAANDPNMYRMFGLDYYDAVLLSGAYQADQIRELEHLRGLPEKELVYAGLTYMDTMADRLSRMRENADGRDGTGRQTVLLAPSWGENSILNRYGTRIIDALLKTDYHIIIRPHPQTLVTEKALAESLMTRFPASDRLEWNKDNDNFDVLARSDILISDFSGIIFDFTLVFDRPLIYADTSYDKSPLDCWWSSEEPWTFATLPKIGRQLTEKDLPVIGRVIAECLADPVMRRAREQAREETWMCRGESAVRTVDYLVNKYTDLRL
ncbi:MAG: CDP-glycerol glycerophosphotransferase family protein [Lachnospiraceae bacterium]|nr:CDP-glycerol glycerophosphotransferase family protein [Lachnospiraceae bacterium]